MKNSIRWFWSRGFHLLVVSLLLFLLVFVTDKIDRSKNDPGEIRSRVQKVLREKETVAERLIRQMQTGDTVGWKSHANGRRGITLFFYRMDTLRFWSGNTVPGIGVVLSPDSLRSPVVHLENGFYRLLQQEDSQTRILACILVSREYPFQNEYLKNGLPEDFGIPGALKISKEPSLFNIEDAGGEFLFSLMPPDTKSPPEWPWLLIFLFISGLVFLLWFLYRATRTILAGSTFIYILGYTSIVLVLRAVQMVTQWPGPVYESALFSPGIYFSSAWIPSLGDLLLHSICLLAVAASVFAVTEEREKNSVQRGFRRWLVPVLMAGLVAAMMVAVQHMIRSLVEDSSIPMDLQDLTGLNGMSLAGFTVIALLYMSVFLLASAAAGSFHRMGGSHGNRPFNSTFTGILVYLVAAAALSTLVLNRSNEGVEQERRRLIAMKLGAHRNPVTEEMYAQTAGLIAGDSMLLTVIGNGNSPDRDLADRDLSRHLLHTYFTGYWNSYSVQITVCRPSRMLSIQPQNYLASCDEYFASIIREFGREASAAGLWYLDYGYGNENYLARITSPAGDVKIYFEFSLKQAYKDLGYPELLVDESVSHLPDLSGYSYGYYQAGQLVRRVGPYSYGFDLAAMADTAKDSYFFERNGFTHFYTRIDADNVMIIGKPLPNLLGRLSPFSYLFLWFSFCTILFYTVFRFPRLRSMISDSFRNRLQAAILAVILSSFIIVGVVVTTFLVRLNGEKDKENLLERALSILVEMQHKFGQVENLSSVPSAEMGTMLIKFSNVFFADINVYGNEGWLVASSRPQIFEEGLISELMNPTAMERLRDGSESMAVVEEQIGSHRYQSAYLPMYNDRNVRTGYINLPYFTRQADLRGEVSSFMVAFINIYVLFILLGLVIAFFIAGYLTAPLKMLAQKIGHTTLARTNEKIEWRRADEVGKLVSEYNRMLDELMVSASKLAASERESAWREMARQVAHEIKNPLTPMKLSVQHLEKSWREGATDWESRLKRFSSALIEQIDTLSAIASEFSDFAKMPPPVNETLDLNEVVQQALDLYKGIPNIEFRVEQGSAELRVFSDRKQLLRVLTNLLNNAVQAIGNEQPGLIEIRITGNGDRHEIRIADNGPGIPPEQAGRIFHPSFTTKSGGTGLGLAIVREIVTAQGGLVTFESAPGTGTTFVITLPGISD